MSTLFEVKLRSIKVDENGFIEEGGLNLLEANLLHPKNEVPLVRALTTVNLIDDEEYDMVAEYKKEVGPCLQEGVFKRELIFKQEIQGASLLEINLSAKEKASGIEKILTKLLGIGALAAIGTITGIGAVVTAVAEGATGTLFSQLEAKDDIKNIGRGFLRIDENTPDGAYSINLFVPRKTIITKKTYDSRRDRWYVERKELKKCYKNGFAKVSIKRI